VKMNQNKIIYCLVLSFCGIILLNVTWSMYKQHAEDQNVTVDLPPPRPNWRKQETGYQIPFNLWQTTPNLTHLASLENLKSWKLFNEPINSTWMDDDMSSNFILHHFGEVVHEIYLKYPLNVMRADFWRVAILYIFGGIYADVDVICFQDVKDWFANQTNNHSWENCKVVIAVEKDQGQNFCNWAFASVKGHPLFRKLLELMIQESSDLSIENPYLVHQKTGPGILTRAMREILEIETPDLRADIIANPSQQTPNVMAKIQSLGICLENDQFFATKNLRNQYASREWNHDFPSWLQQRDRERLWFGHHILGRDSFNG